MRHLAIALLGFWTMWHATVYVDHIIWVPAFHYDGPYDSLAACQEMIDTAKVIQPGTYKCWPVGQRP